MIYLASPYSAPDAATRQLNFELVEHCVACLTQRNVPAFSPILYLHTLSHKYNLPTYAGFWERFNMQFLRKAGAIYVLKIDGWEESLGVRQEMEFAKAAYLPLHFVDENGIEVL